MSCNLNRCPFWRRSLGLLAVLLLLLGNREAWGQGYLLRYVNTASGAVTFTGNTLGLNKATGANAPGNSGSIGAFITLNTNSNAGGGYPNGTTLNWSNNSSAAVLRMPTNSTVLYAELIWAGSAQVNGNDTSAAGDVLPYLNTPVQFILPNGSTNSITPDPATASLVTNGTTAIFYCRSANVTALVQAAGAGGYAVGGVPATVLAAENSNNAGGWTLAVVYGNASLHQRNLSLFVGNYFVTAGQAAPPPVSVQGFCTPPNGVVNAYMFVSAIEGDPQTSGDHMYFGANTNSLVQLSGPNNLINNFFASQINYCQPDNLLGTVITNGYLDTTGTFGLSNSLPGTGVSGARQGWDITCVNASAGLTNGDTSAYVQGDTVGDGYSIDALALQIDVGAPVLTAVQTVDKASTYVGDILTYTVVATNSGTADALNLVFTDPLPFGTSFVPNSFTTNGVAVAGANPVNGVTVPIIKQNSGLKVTYQVLVGQIPPSAQFVTAAKIDFQYEGACANSPTINATIVNANVQTLVPLLNITKASTLDKIIPGATFTYTISIPNVGTTNTSGATLIDPIPAGLTYIPNTTTLNGTSIPDIGGTNMPYTAVTEIHGPGRPVGVINVGDTVVITFQVQISTNPPVRIINSATVYANGSAVSSGQNAANVISPVYADLGVGIIGSPNPVAAGAPISYTVSITNNGPDSLNDITNFITLSLPLSGSILSPVYTPSSGSYNPFTGVWSGITLASNNVITLTISGQVSPNTSASNIVSSVNVIPPPGILDLVTNNNFATTSNTVVQVADLAVSITDGVTSVHQGDVLTYTVTAVNLGPSTLTSISVSNAFSGLTGLSYAPSEGNYNPANGTWNGLNLSAGDSVTLTVFATVLNNVVGSITNVTTVSVPPGVTDPVLTNNTASDVDVVFGSPDLAIGKTGPTTAFAGTNFSYTLTVTNIGFATASNLVVSDVLPTNVTFVSASGNGANNSGVVNWTVTSLATNVITNFTLTVTAPFTGSITNIASVTASTLDSTPGNNTSSPVATTVTPLADLVIGKTAPTLIVASSNFIYTISITNLGPSPASAVVVTDALPANLTFVSATGGGVNSGGSVHWALGTFASGQVSNLFLTVKAPASGVVTNTAKASSSALDTNTVNNTSPPVISTVTTLALSANVGVFKTGPATVLAKTNFTYSITVTNSGPATASNVVASDVLPANVVFVSATGGGTLSSGTVSWNLGTFTNSATTNFTVTVTAPANGTITNTATVTSTTADSTVGNNTSAPVGTIVTPLADIGVSKSGPTNVFAGTNFTYTITVTNAGPSTASNVMASDVLPTNIVFVSASGGGTTNASSANWTIGALASGTATNLILTVTAPASGAITNTATVTSTTSDPNPTNNTSLPVFTTVVPVADVAIGKTAAGTVLAGGSLTYTLSVTNLGPSSASGVVVTDALPAGVTFVSATGGGVDNAGVVNWTLGTLTNSQATNFTVTVTAPAGGSLTNVASVASPTSDPNGTNNVTPPVLTAVTPVADVGVGKAGPAGGYLGGVLSYTISVTNLGPSSASGVVVTDALPAGLALVSAVPVAGTNGSNQVIWNLGNVGAGVVTNLTLNVTALVRGPVTNVATGGSPVLDPNLTNNASVPVVTGVTNRPPVANPDSAVVGENSVTNVLSPLGNDSDPDGDPLTVIGVSATNGTAVIVGTNVVFTPLTNFVGVAYVGYTISDGNGGVSSAVITIGVTNGAPVANPDSYNVLENSTNSFSPLTNDTVTTPGGVLSLVGVVATNGTAVVSGTNVIFIPATNFVGTTTLIYTITDGIGGTNSSTITVNVAAVADVAVLKTGPASVTAATNFSYTITVTNRGPGTAASLTVTDALPAAVTFVSASGGAVRTGSQLIWGNLGSLAAGVATNLTVTVTAPAGGSLTNVAGGGSPTSDPNPTNNTSLPVFTTVVPVADVAIGKTAAGTVLAGGSLTYTLSVTNLGPSSASGVVVTDALPAGVTFVSATGGGVDNAGVVNWTLGTLTNSQATNFTVTVTAPAGGSLTNVASVASPTSDPNGTNNVTPPVLTAVTPVADVGVGKAGPAGGYLGGVLSYTISVTNLGPSSASGVVVTDALPAGLALVSAVPVAGTNGSNQVIWNLGNVGAGVVTNLTLNVTALVRGPVTNVATGGSPVLDPNLTNNASVPVVTGVTNRPPVANPDSAVVGENSVTNVLSPLGNDSDPDGDPLTVIGVSATNGTAVIVGTNVVFTPLTNFVGVAYVGYTISDGNGGVSSAVITIGVTNGAPVANPDSYNVLENSTNSFSPLTNDTVTTPGGVLSLVGVVATNGTAVVSGTNVIFIPATNFVGTTTLIYTITDGIGGTNSSTITVTVTNAVHNPPVAVNDSYTALQNMPLVVPASGVLTNDTDADGHPLTAILVSSPAHGILVLSTNGGFTYTPTNNFTGTDTFTYRANDGFTNSDIAMVTISVLPAADIAVSKTGPASGIAGSNLVYVITVTNNGPSTATNVLVNDLLPAGLTFVSATPATATVSNNLVSWPGFSLANNAKTSFTVTAISSTGGSYTNIAFSTSGTLDQNPTNNNGSAANSQVRTVVTPSADVAVFKVGGTNIFAGSAITYTITATNFGPSTATNVVVSDQLPGNAVFQSASAGYTLSNGIVTWPSLVLAKGDSTNFTVVLTAPASGAITNLAFSTSDTPDPNPTNNDGSSASSRVRSSITPSADLIVMLSGPTNVSVGNSFTYTITVTNSGPSTSTNISVQDRLPANLTFVSASGGGTFLNNLITWPNIASLTNGAVTTFTLTVTAPGLGDFTNVAFEVSGTFDPNLTNNDGTSPVSQVRTIVASSQFALLAGTPVFNPQTGLFEEPVIVTNIGTTTVAGVRLYVAGLRSGVTLYNATGTTNGTPYLQYNSSLNPGDTVTFALEFYDVNRLPFTSTLTAVAILPPNVPTAGTNGVAVTREFTDTRIVGDTRFVIEFTTVPGKTYTVIYSDDLATWKVATPSVTANANVTQWYDDGPPKTDSKPASVGSRFYRVIQN